jgi:hypothetical protein
VNIVLTLDIPLERVADLLCSAFEGGSNYWYRIEDYKPPAGDPKRWAFRFDEHRVEVFPHVDYPLNSGGSLLVSDAAEMGEAQMTVKGLNLLSITEGLKVMARDYARHFADFMAEKDDACTGDVFLQCCLFGKVVYG